MDALDGMNAVLRNFKNIPCPQGDSCTTPNCQWKHTWETEPVVAKSKTTTPEEYTDEAGPKKRQRLDEAGRDRPNSRLNSEPGVTTATNSVSPPPLKRKAPAQLTKTPVKHSQPGAANTPSSSTPKTVTHTKGVTPLTATTRTPISAPASVNPSAAAQKTPKKAPRKPEPLNPRHLKSSPATHEFRYKALRMLHEQLVRLNAELKKDANDDEEKLVLNEQELIWLALDLEEHAAVDKPPIYSNIIKNRITSYKRMSVATWKEERLAEQKKEAAAASNMQAAKGPVLGPPRVVDTGLTLDQELAFLQLLITPIASLAAHKYVPVAPSEQAIEKARQAEADSKGWEQCDRCGTRFQVFPGRREEDGALAGGGPCNYHSGRKMRPQRTAVDAKDGHKHAEQWLCCQEEVGSSRGCTQAKTHVFKTTDPPRLALVMPYMETPPNPSAPTDRAVCFDCEMGYTVKGFELIRLTATSWPDGKVILDVLVQPVGEILDFNSRYSGVFPEDFANAPLYSPQYEESSPGSVPDQALKEGEVDEAPAVRRIPKIPETSPLQKVSSPLFARDLLFSLISPSTPLIGHAIENDLGAVRVIHPTVIDTVLLFPHSRGPLPMRNGLKMLMRQHLNRDIQVETAEQRGHDSAEDARAAGELVRFKVMTEWQRRKQLGWKVHGTSFLWPGWKGSLTEDFIEKPGANGQGNRAVVGKGMNGLNGGRD
ncbi:exonuclease [Coniochaeta ligniaria NRRL 30616]|uniref:Exonuclease n=1 Tax=Coniochaeta ligniaria NRRL 30616 TaxID=1408157 RepID=A0A1J7J7H8_9PEZI|nr:exonuclease [Coniochaeta ligniaria NRRL 30616]